MFLVICFIMYGFEHRIYQIRCKSTTKKPNMQINRPKKWILLAKKAFKDDLFGVRRKVRT